MKIVRSSSIEKLIKRYKTKKDSWKDPGNVAVVFGLPGCGKTSLLLDYFEKKKHFYFSLASLEESVAENLLANKISLLSDISIVGWDDIFKTLSSIYQFIIFDDITPVYSYKRFKESFNENMFSDHEKRPLVFFIAQTNDPRKKLFDSYDSMFVKYFSITEVMKYFPKLSQMDYLGIYTISGGIPKILYEYNPELSINKNLLSFLKPSSAFMEFMPGLMNNHFRKPEVYHNILNSIANGNNRISVIGKFTGYEYNKCDNYVSVLLSAGIIKTEKQKSKHGTNKNVYVFTNPYFRLWYRYIFLNRTEIVIGNNIVIEDIINNCVFRFIRTGIPIGIRTVFRKYPDTIPILCGQRSGGIRTLATSFT